MVGLTLESLRFVTVWLDKHGFLPEQARPAALVKAAAECDVLLLLLSKQSRGPAGLHPEIQTGLQAAAGRRGGLRVIPVRFDEVPLSQLGLSGLPPVVDLFPQWDVGMARLVRSVGGQEASPAQPPRAAGVATAAARPPAAAHAPPVPARAPAAPAKAPVPVKAPPSPFRAAAASSPTSGAKSAPAARHSSSAQDKSLAVDHSEGSIFSDDELLDYPGRKWVRPMAALLAVASVVISWVIIK